MTQYTLEDFKYQLGYDGHPVDTQKALDMLKEIGTDATNEIGETPLIIAAYLGQSEVLKTLIPNYAHIDHTNNFGDSALLAACDQRRLESIKLLIEAGAAIEQQDRFGYTPLAKIFTNTFSDPIPCATYLIQQGAKLTERVIDMGKAWDKERFEAFVENYHNPDKQAIDKLTQAFWGIFYNKNGATPNWEIIKELCIAEVLIIKKNNTQQEVYNLESFITPRKKLLSDGTLLDFEEKEIEEETQIIGNIAQRATKYTKEGLLNGEYFQQNGHKLFQYVKTDKGWQISAVVWEDE